MSRRGFVLKDIDPKLSGVKAEICEFLEYEMAFTQLTQKNLARKLATSQANISRVLTKRVEQLTFNQLFKFMAILNPHFRILISRR